jgi:hypothetical protein
MNARITMFRAGVAGLGLMRLMPDGSEAEIATARKAMGFSLEALPPGIGESPLEVDVVTGYQEWAETYDLPGNPLIQLDGDLRPARQPLDPARRASGNAPNRPAADRPRARYGRRVRAALEEAGCAGTSGTRCRPQRGHATWAERAIGGPPRAGGYVGSPTGGRRRRHRRVLPGPHAPPSVGTPHRGAG